MIPFKKIVASAMITLSLFTGLNTISVGAATNYTPGAKVSKDTNSPSGYTVSFVYDGAKENNLESVSIVGAFSYFKDADTSKVYTPQQYVNGMDPAGFQNVTMSMYEEKMKNISGSLWKLSFPITSGSFNYSYKLTYKDGTNKTIADPANPVSFNPDSTFQTSNINSSYVYGAYDPVRQSNSTNYSFVMPAASKKGTVKYVKYTGNLTNVNLKNYDIYDKTTKQYQTLGVYLPFNYNAKRSTPYKVIYLSHGGGGNETDWFLFGHADNIMDNIIANGGEEAIIVTLSNMDYRKIENGTSWNYSLIEDNVINYVIPYMEKNYNVSKKVTDRAFAGLSMGSLTTTKMWLDQSDKFGYFGMFSGSYLFKADGTTTASKFSEISKYTYSELNKPILLVGAGYEDIALGQLNGINENGGRTTERLTYMLRNEGYTNYTRHIVNGGHCWFTWSNLLYEFMSDTAWSTATLNTSIVKFDKTSYTYTGKPIDPKVTVQLNGKTLKKNVDYTLSYSNNTNVGTATVIIKGKGNYTGTISKTFNIVSSNKK